MQPIALAIIVVGAVAVLSVALYLRHARLRSLSRSHAELDHDLRRGISQRLLAVSVLGGAVAGIAAVGGPVAAICLTVVVVALVAAALVTLRRDRPSN